MANLILNNNTATTNTELTLSVKDKTSWKIINKAGTFVIYGGKDLLTIDTAGNILPKTAIAQDLGSSTLPWNEIFSKYFYVYDGTNTTAPYAQLLMHTKGTTST